MKYLLSLMVVLGAISASAGGSTATVRCHAPKYPNQFVVLKMINGMLTQWDATHVARPDANSIFLLLAEDTEEGVLESVRFGKAKNGYAMVTVVTTADALTLGVSPSLENGFYNYQDLGSGNGNKRLDLICEKI